MCICTGTTFYNRTVCQVHTGTETIIRAGRNPTIIGICGNRGAFRRMYWTVSNRHTLDYIKTGEDRPQSWLWRSLFRRNHYRH